MQFLFVAVFSVFFFLFNYTVPPSWLPRKADLLSESTEIQKGDDDDV